MKLIHKIKSYFVKYDFYSWKDFQWENYDLVFKSIDDSLLLDIGIYLKQNLGDADGIGNNRHRLKANDAISCDSLDDLLPLLQKIVGADYLETSTESLVYNWDFNYFVSHHNLCKNTICIYNGLRDKNGATGNCIYPVASVRKFNGNYFCWNHLE